jgi:class 3 adenylate cyclase
MTVEVDRRQLFWPWVSTTGWEGDRAAMAAAIMRHYEILDAAVRARGGARPVEQGEGDSVVAVFPLASEAVWAAVDIQLALAAELWPDGPSWNASPVD